MDNVLDNIANSLFNGLLPAAWSKLAPATCKQLASWLEHLRVSRLVQLLLLLLLLLLVVANPFSARCSLISSAQNQSR
ncbi:hypothetical protein M5D96_000690 [Drosophila gunungcola]|uniref:Dynein heavy chain C-terminal domain-containing protein n=1 Tax=Drosophila gunungcola TaxID=103775 RepID=A0A9P9YWT6_9MUSC|nr:hypothetical protein M5D96_000690 [Drosophila gunungcola]